MRDPCIYFLAKSKCAEGRGRARTLWSVPWRIWELLSMAGIVGLREEPHGLECGQEVRADHGGPLKP